MEQLDIKNICLDKAIETVKSFDIGDRMVVRDVVSLAMIYEAYLTDDGEALILLYED